MQFSITMQIYAYDMTLDNEKRWRILILAPIQNCSASKADERN